MKLILVSAAAAALLFAGPASAASKPKESPYGKGKPAAEVYREGHAAKKEAESPYGKGKPAAEVYREGQAAKKKAESPYGKGTPADQVYREGQAAKKKAASPYGKGTPAQEVYRKAHSPYGKGTSPQEVYRQGHSGDRNRNWDNFNRRNVRAEHHYRWHGNSWNWPHGYSYRRWSFGMALPSIFWGRDYWIDDYSDYGLGYPPPGTVWVRYGNDALLIDRDTGEILEVVYDQFY